MAELSSDSSGKLGWSVWHHWWVFAVQTCEQGVVGHLQFSPVINDGNCCTESFQIVQVLWTTETINTLMFTEQVIRWQQQMKAGGTKNKVITSSNLPSRGQRSSHRLQCAALTLSSSGWIKLEDESRFSAQSRLNFTQQRNRERVHVVSVEQQAADFAAAFTGSSVWAADTHTDGLTPRLYVRCLYIRLHHSAGSLCTQSATRPSHMNLLFCLLSVFLMFLSYITVGDFPAVYFSLFIIVCFYLHLKCLNPGSTVWQT